MISMLHNGQVEKRSLVMKNKILSCINMVDMFFLALFISCMDSMNVTIPTIGIVICAALLLICYLYRGDVNNKK